MGKIKTSNHRERFFRMLETKTADEILYVPDITYWYVSKRTLEGQQLPFPPGAFIPDDADIHRVKGNIPDEFADLTLMDFYRKYNWGFHAHIYDWLDVSYGGECDKRIEGTKTSRKIILKSPKRELYRVEKLAVDGTWCPVEHFVKCIDDLEILKDFLVHIRQEPNHEMILHDLNGIGQMGQADLVIGRSPFGKLVHEYVGFENVTYWLMDHPQQMQQFLDFQWELDLQIIELASKAPTQLVIISDHTDETLISPKMYEKYCIPFYQEACRRLHAAGKYVSTHLDGNIRGYFPLLSKTGFDLLDGCTPAPMFNYEPEELAEALPEGMVAFCGVPATLFCQNVPNAEIFKYADRIIDALKGRCIVNVGDILSPNGDIQQVIALGEYIRERC